MPAFKNCSVPLVEEFFHFHHYSGGGKWKSHRVSTDFPLVEKWWNFPG